MKKLTDPYGRLRFYSLNPEACGGGESGHDPIGSKNNTGTTTDYDSVGS